MAPAKPQVLALVVCDAVHRDPTTGKHTLLGCFNALSCRGFPATHPGLALHAALTEGYGRVPVEARLVRTDGQEVLHRLRVEVVFEDPRAVAEVTFAFREVLVPAPEELRVQVLAEGEVLAERRLRVLGRPAGAEHA